MCYLYEDAPRPALPGRPRLAEPPPVRALAALADRDAARRGRAGALPPAARSRPAVAGGVARRPARRAGDARRRRAHRDLPLARLPAVAASRPGRAAARR